MQNHIECNVISLPAKHAGEENAIFVNKTDIPFGKHLYFTSNEEIKEGDWFTNTELPKLYRATLISDSDVECEINDCYVPKRYVRKILASTDPLLGLPVIPESFLKQYVAAQASIKTVRLELEYNSGWAEKLVKMTNEPFILHTKIKLTAANEVIILPEEQEKSIVINKELDKYSDKVLFPKAVEKARKWAEKIDKKANWEAKSTKYTKEDIIEMLSNFTDDAPGSYIKKEIMKILDKKS